jgi:tRNA (guanine37-N1)-methyltransferase
MRIFILTCLPEMFDSFLKASILGKAIEANKIQIEVVPLRDFSDPPHYRLDDTPYGGGPGMVMKAEPILRAIASLKKHSPNARVIFPSPSGEVFNQKKATELKVANELIFLCGRYEGVDQRAIDLCVDAEVSIGDYVLMGGEVATMAIIEATTRLLPGVLGNKDSSITESFSETTHGRLLEAPQYTKPSELPSDIAHGSASESLRKVPTVLLSGDHSAINKWRNSEGLARTKARRPDLLK